MNISLSNAEITAVQGVKIKLSLEFNTDHHIDGIVELETIYNDIQSAFNTLVTPILQKYGPSSIQENSDKIAKALSELASHL